MDIQISWWIVNTFGNSQAMATIAKIITFGGSKWFLMGLVAVLLIFKKTRKMAIYAAAVALLTFVLNDFVIKNIVKRDRPFVADEGLKQMCELAKYKFPTGYSMTSGHAAVTMAVAVMIMMHSWKLGIPAMIYSFLVGLSRIVLCVHFFTDVLAGFVLGTIMAIIIYFAINLILKLWKKRRNKNENNSVSVSEQA